MDGEPALIDDFASTVGESAASELLTDVCAFESAIAPMFRIESRDALMEKSLMFHESVQPAPTGQSGIVGCNIGKARFDKEGRTAATLSAYSARFRGLGV